MPASLRVTILHGFRLRQLSRPLLQLLLRLLSPLCLRMKRKISLKTFLLPRANLRSLLKSPPRGPTSSCFGTLASLLVPFSVSRCQRGRSRAFRSTGVAWVRAQACSSTIPWELVSFYLWLNNICLCFVFELCVGMWTVVIYVPVVIYVEGYLIMCFGIIFLSLMHKVSSSPLNIVVIISCCPYCWILLELSCGSF